MKKQYFMPAEIREKQLACPFSVGQAEPGRWTFCIADSCLAWTWNADLIEHDEIGEKDPVPEGWQVNSEPFKVGKKSMVKIIRKPTHGRCGLVP